MSSGTAQHEASASSQTWRKRWDTRVFSLVPPPAFPAMAYTHPNGRVYAGTYTDPKGGSMPSRVFEWSADGSLLRSWTVPGQDLSADRGVQVTISDAQGRLVLLEKSRAQALLLDVTTGEFQPYATFADLPQCSPLQCSPLQCSPLQCSPLQCSPLQQKGCSPSVVNNPPIPNFGAWGPDGSLYVTDYGQAVLWRVPPGGGAAEVWLADRKLDGIKFGTTGLALAGDRTTLLVAQQSSGGLGELNPTTGKLYGVSIQADGSAGSLRMLWESRPADAPDGFAVARSGRIYLANLASNQLVVLSSGGRELERFPKLPLTGANGSAVPFDAPSSAAFLGTRLMVANQSYLTSNPDHQAILDVETGEPGLPVFIPDNAGLPG